MPHSCFYLLLREHLHVPILSLALLAHLLLSEWLRTGTFYSKIPYPQGRWSERSAINFIWCFCSKKDEYNLTQPELHYIIFISGLKIYILYKNKK
jgi:hypothetical protein